MIGPGGLKDMAGLMSMPTRIISPPKKERLDGKRVIVCRCDNGGKYSIRGLAEVVGLPWSTLSNRLANMGWDDPRIFELGRQENKSRIDTGNDEWVALGSRARSENLSRFPKAGLFEQAMVG